MKRVLVVDDDHGVRHLAGWILASAGFDVETACDGREALMLMRSDKPDVVVLDLNMPIMDGYEFFREIEPKERPQVLILSADGAEKARQALGADASLQKPFRPDDLVSKVEALSERL